jgi:hypothetical protein
MVKLLMINHLSDLILQSSHCAHWTWSHRVELVNDCGLGKAAGSPLQVVYAPSLDVKNVEATLGVDIRPAKVVHQTRHAGDA